MRDLETICNELHKRGYNVYSDFGDAIAVERGETFYTWENAPVGDRALFLELDQAVESEMNR